GMGSWRGAPSCVIIHLTNRTGHVIRRVGKGALSQAVPTYAASMQPRRPLVRVRWGVTVARPAGHELSQPFAMMPPRPAARTIAARHRPDGAAHPDRCIDVHDPHADCHDRRERVDEDGDLLLL